MGTAKRVRWHFLLAASLVLGQALPISAMPIIYQFESGSVDFGFAPDIATVSGTFEFDTSINLVTSADIRVTNAGQFNGRYSVLTSLGSLGFNAVREGTILGPPLNGETVFSLLAGSPLAAPGGAIELFDISLGTCSNPNCSFFLSSPFQSIGGSTGINIVELASVVSVAVPATAPLFLVGLGGLALLRRRS
ncbi:MAG: hypothetical protein AAFY29_18020 [Pseudomonadota bacterium]